jgi:DNA-binding CsgD family transcriptional regulator
MTSFAAGADKLRLLITIRRVRFHVSNLLRKLDVQSRAEVIILAHNAGTPAPEDM